MRHANATSLLDVPLTTGSIYIVWHAIVYTIELCSKAVLLPTGTVSAACYSPSQTNFRHWGD